MHDAAKTSPVARLALLALRAFAVLVAGALPAQPTAWAYKPAFRASFVEDMVYDAARQRLVAVWSDAYSRIFRSPQPGFDGTWEWDGARWTARPAPVEPSPGVGCAMAYDTARQRVVLCGGWDPVNQWAVGETWEWDGVTWVQRSDLPVARYDHAMAYDAARQRVVLFGGSDGGPNGDTWEWNGTSWTQRATPVAPAARWGHAMAYDESRQRVLLHGGVDSSNLFLGDTWEWDGSAWAPRSTATGPSPRGVHAIAYDSARQRVVLFGGSSGPVPYLGDTWEWDGSTWTSLTTTVAPAPRVRHAMTYDAARRRIVVLGGWDNQPAHEDAWEWDGAMWTKRTTAQAPPIAGGILLAYDDARQEVVSFTNQAQTWSWNGTSWTQRAPAQSPSSRSGHAMAYDGARQRVLYFGGSLGYPVGPLADTWLWDGTTWTLVPTLPAPIPRFAHALAYDAARRRVVLFGGLAAGNVQLADTWEWDGTSWTQRSPLLAPPPRSAHAMAYDAVRGRVVLFGGFDTANYADLRDTWEWDGASWTQRVVTAVPWARSSHAMVYDAARQRVVMFGGEAFAGFGTSGWPLDDTWEWDGATWTPVSIATPPAGRSYHAMAYDGARQRVVLCGGHAGSGRYWGYPFHDTWVYGVTTPAAATAFGVGCAGNASPPQIAAFTLPRPGEESFALDLVGPRASAPVVFPLSVNAANTPLPGGCTLYVDHATLLATPVTLTNASGFATLALPVPRTSVWIGLTLHTQAAVLDPTAPLGLALTQGLRLTIGE